MRVGVLGAMPEEVAAVIGMLGPSVRTHAGGRDYARGTHAGHEVVAVHSRIGKVAAASAAVELIVRFGVEQVVFTGLAGALCRGLRAGDVVVGDGLVQHDMDASPLFPPLEVPLTGCSRFGTTPAIAERLEASALATLEALGESFLRELGVDGGRRPAVRRGVIATGDRFIAGAESREGVLRLVPGAVCVEREGAAGAQGCQEYGMPFGIIRMISDGADESAAADFASALGRVAGEFAAAVVSRYLESLPA